MMPVINLISVFSFLCRLSSQNLCELFGLFSSLSLLKFLYSILNLFLNIYSVLFSSVQSLSRVRLFTTPWIPAHQAYLSITNSQSSLRLTSIESVVPSSHLILCHPLLLLPPIPPNIRVFSNESTLYLDRVVRSNFKILGHNWAFILLVKTQYFQVSC